MLADLDRIKRGVPFSWHYRHFFGERRRDILALLWRLKYIFLGSKNSSQILFFSNWNLVLVMWILWSISCYIVVRHIMEGIDVR
jgi:hypothetical protein